MVIHRFRLRVAGNKKLQTKNRCVEMASYWVDAKAPMGTNCLPAQPTKSSIMIIARSKPHHGKNLILIGLTKSIIGQLRHGHPIEVRRKTSGHGVPKGWTIGIIYGETDLDNLKTLDRPEVMARQLKIKIQPKT